MCLLQWRDPSKNDITKTVGALYEFMTILYNKNKYAKLCSHYIAFLTVKHYENALPVTDRFSFFSYLICDQITSYLIIRSILSEHLILQQSRPVPRAVHAATLDVIYPSPQLHYDVMHSTQPYGQPRAAHMYSSIYRVQSTTRRLPIRALFGFMLKQSSPILPFPSESPSVVVCPRSALGRLITTSH